MINRLKFNFEVVSFPVISLNARKTDKKSLKIQYYYIKLRNECKI